MLDVVLSGSRQSNGEGEYMIFGREEGEGYSTSGAFPNAPMSIRKIDQMEQLYGEVERLTSTRKPFILRFTQSQRRSAAFFKAR